MSYPADCRWNRQISEANQRHHAIRRGWHASRYALIAALWPRLRILDIADAMDMTPDAVRVSAAKLGLPPRRVRDEP